MRRARDRYDDWFEEEADPRDDYAWEPEEPRLSLVREPSFAFEVMSPANFEAAQTIADRLRSGAPVMIDFHACDEQLTGRLTDFCSGLVYALEGGLQHVGEGVMLLTPSHMDVSGDEDADVRRPGFFNRL